MLLVGPVLLIRSRRKQAREGTGTGKSLPTSQPVGDPCTTRGCNEKATWACRYRNATGQPCGSHWCKNHVVVVAGAAYCLRHAGVSKTLNQTEGSIYQVKSLPSLSKTAPFPSWT